MLETRPDVAPAGPQTTADKRWARVRDSGIGVLVWLVIAGLVLWALGHVARTLLVLVLAALLAYAVTPAVRWLRRWLRGRLGGRRFQLHLCPHQAGGTMFRSPATASTWRR